MTTEEIIVALYEGSYEQDELNPYDAAGNVDAAIPGCASLIAFINRAISIVSTWKFPNGMRVRFRSNNGMAYARTPETGYDFLFDDPSGVLSYNAGFSLAADAIDAATPNLVNLPVAFAKEDGFYKGYSLSLPNGDKCFVMDSTGSQLVTEEPVDVIHNLDPFMLHASSFTIGDGPLNTINLQGFISVLDVYDKSSSASLDRKQSDAFFDVEETSIGNPSTYYVYGDRIYFDTMLQKPKVYRFRYWKYPKKVEQVTDRVDLPEAFHEAVFLCAKAELLRRIGEATEAYASQKSLENLMITLRSEADFDQDNERARVYPEAL